MRRKIELIMGILLLLGVIAVSATLSQQTDGKAKKGKASDKDRKDVYIMIDAGHGGKDPGKVGVDDVLEKEINLQISKKLEKKLKDKKIKVKMTRTKDEAANTKVEDMKNRVALINEEEPDLVVSIHQNSYQDASVKGAQVFYFTHSSEAEKAAKILQEALLKVDPDNHRQAKANDTYYMLKKSSPPTVIVECGFLSNPEEAKKLSDEKYQEEMAEAICEGIEEMLEE